MCASRLILKIYTVMVVHLIVYTAAINEDVSNGNQSDSLHIGQFKHVGPKHFLFDEPQRTINLAFHYMTLILFIPLTIIVNVLVLLTVGLIKSLHTPHDIMLAISALMDLLVGVVYLPADVFEQYDDHSYIGNSELSCELLIITTLPFSLSLTSYVLMSAERWVGVVFPFWYQMHVTCLNIAMASAMVLCTELILEITFVFMLVQYDKTAPIVVRCEVHKIFPHWYIDLLETIVISMKLTVSLILSICVNVIARKHRRTMKDRSRPLFFRKSNVPFSERLSLKPIICSLIFFILWTPKLIFENLRLSLSSKDHLRYVDLLLESFIVMNSFVNPLIIISMKPLYRNSFKIILSTPPWKCGSLKKRLRMIVYQSQQDNDSSSMKSKEQSKFRPSIDSESAVGMMGDHNQQGYNSSSMNSKESSNLRESIDFENALGLTPSFIKDKDNSYTKPSEVKDDRPLSPTNVTSSGSVKKGNLSTSSSGISNEQKY